MRDLSQTLENTTYRRSYKSWNVMQVNSLLAVCIVLLCLVYLFTINNLATEGIKIKQLTSQISKLEEEHKSLELQNSTLQSVSTIQQESAQLNFVPATDVIYLKSDNFALK